MLLTLGGRGKTHKKICARSGSVTRERRILPANNSILKLCCETLHLFRITSAYHFVDIILKCSICIKMRK
jgi:hypothetical protein